MALLLGDYPELLDLLMNVRLKPLSWLLLECSIRYTAHTEWKVRTTLYYNGFTGSKMLDSKDVDLTLA